MVPEENKNNNNNNNNNNILVQVLDPDERVVMDSLSGDAYDELVTSSKKVQHRRQRLPAL